MVGNNNINSQKEIILAQEQSVTCKAGNLEREYQGTLVLTNKRLLFTVANQEQDVAVTPLSTARLSFADIKDLNNISKDPGNLAVLLNELEVEKGHEGLFRLTTLKIKWKEGGKARSAEFVEDIAGAGRKENLKDWARVVELLKAGEIHLQFPSAPVPSIDTLEGKVLYVLNDMQEKGIFEIQEGVEDAFKGEDVDPDELDDACRKLASQGFLEVIKDPSGDNFYKKRSPLGEDDLSN